MIFLQAQVAQKELQAFLISLTRFLEAEGHPVNLKKGAQTDLPA